MEEKGAVQIMADPRPTFAQNPGTTPPPYDEFRNAFFGNYAYWGSCAAYTRAGR
jgi:hypothetical protein